MSWTNDLESLSPGAHFAVFADVSDSDYVGVAGRLHGLELRDTMLVLRDGFHVGFVFVFRKPLVGTVVEQVLSTGTGGLNINACRVGTEGGTRRGSQKPYAKVGDREDRSGVIVAHDERGDGYSRAGSHWARTGHEIIDIGMGRWPANVIMVGRCPKQLSSYFPQVKDQQELREWISKLLGN